MKLNLDRKLISGSLAAKIQNFQANQKNSTTKGNAINWLFVEKLNKHVPQHTDLPSATVSALITISQNADRKTKKF